MGAQSAQPFSSSTPPITSVCPTYAHTPRRRPTAIWPTCRSGRSWRHPRCLLIFSLPPSHPPSHPASHPARSASECTGGAPSAAHRTACHPWTGPGHVITCTACTRCTAGKRRYNWHSSFICQWYNNPVRQYNPVRRYIRCDGRRRYKCGTEAAGNALTARRHSTSSNCAADAAWLAATVQHDVAALTARVQQMLQVVLPRGNKAPTGHSTVEAAGGAAAIQPLVISRRKLLRSCGAAGCGGRRLLLPCGEKCMGHGRSGAAVMHDIGASVAATADCITAAAASGTAAGISGDNGGGGGPGGVARGAAAAAAAARTVCPWGLMVLVVPGWFHQAGCFVACDVVACGGWGRPTGTQLAVFFAVMCMQVLRQELSPVAASTALCAARCSAVEVAVHGADCVVPLQPSKR